MQFLSYVNITPGCLKEVIARLVPKSPPKGPAAPVSSSRTRGISRDWFTTILGELTCVRGHVQPGQVRDGSVRHLEIKLVSSSLEILGTELVQGVFAFGVRVNLTANCRNLS